MSIEPLRVCIFAENRHNVFSGGRYHSWHMAEALAARGHIVHYVTNNIPVFYDEFDGAPGHDKVKVHISKEFLTNLPTGPLDVVVVTPGRSDYPVFYRSARMLALSTGAQMTLINFEAGNWFNAMAPVKRELSDWDHWKRVVSAGGLVLSSAHESDRWAREFYNEYEDDRLHFDVWSPPINSTAADSVAWHEKENRVAIISRLADPHKGFQTVLNALPDNISGWTLAVMTGSSVEPAFEAELRTMAASKGINLELIMRPSDKEKFEEFKRAKLMLFPSLFEGYGYPPIEALYCNTDVVSYDLPVVRETCGGLAIYVPHGDEDSFREAISRALIDPQLGKRDYHSQMYNLANLMPAAERIEAVFEKYQNPENRTTGRYQGGVISSLDTEGRIEKSRHTVAPGWTRQVRRIASLRDPSNWRPAGKKVVSMAGRLLNQLDHKYGVSGATIDQFGVISIRGWYLGPQRPTNIRVQVGDDIEADMESGLRRPDIQKKYPQYGEPNPGFQVLLRFVDRDLSDAPYKIFVDVRDEVVMTIEGNLKPADKTNQKPASTLPGRKRNIRGKSVAVIADFERVKSGTEEKIYLDNLLISLRNLDMLSHLILQGNPADILPYESDFTALADEVLISDVVKPSVQQEVFDQDNHVSQSTLDALDALQSRQVLVCAVCCGAEMSPALESCGAGVVRATQLWSPDFRENARTLLQFSDLIITPNATISALMKPVADRAEFIQLSLLADAFPSHVGLGPVLTNNILIPDSGMDGAVESTLEFIEGVNQRRSDIRFNILGNLGDNVTDAILREDRHAHLLSCVNALGRLHDTAEAYADAGLVAFPYLPPINDETSVTDWLALEVNVIRCIASERPMIAAPEIAKAFNTAYLLMVGTHDGTATLSDRAIGLLESPEDSQTLIEEGRAFKQNRLHRPTETRSLEAVLKRPTFPAQRLLVMEEDERVAALFKTLLSANSLMPSNTAVDLFLGQDVTINQAAIDLLKERSCSINALYSFRTDFQGLKFNDINIKAPAQSDQRPAVVASYEDHESLDVINRCVDLGYTTIVSGSMTPDQRDSRQAEKLRSTARYQEVHILCARAERSAATPSSSSDKRFMIATDVFALREDVSDVLQNMNVITCGNPIVSHKSPNLLRSLSPQGIVVTTDLDPTPTGPDTRQYLRVIPETPPWFPPPDLRNHQIFRVSADNDRESLRLAVGLALWSGARSITVHGAAKYVNPDTGETCLERQSGWAYLSERDDFLDFAADHDCRLMFQDTVQSAEVEFEHG